MTNPVPDSYSAYSGESIFAGRQNPVAISVIGVAAAGLAAGSFVEISASNLNVMPDGETRFPNQGQIGDEFTDWAVSGVYDKDQRRVYISGAPAGTILNPGASAILRLDIDTNAWDTVYDPWGVIIGHCYDACGYYDGILYKSRFQGGTLRYDTVTDTALTLIPDPPTDIGAGSAAWATIEGITMHPNMGASGSLVWCNSSLGRNCRYDLDTETWTLLNQTGNIQPVGPVAHYSEVSGKAIYGIGRSTDPLYMVDADTSVTATQNCPDDMMAGGQGVLFAADPNTANSILIRDNGEIYSLSHATGLWTYEYDTPANYPDLRNSQRFITTLDDYGVFLIVDYQTGGNSKCYLYRYSS